MDWQEFSLSRTFVREERLRPLNTAAVAQEDEAFAAASKALQATRR
jgi:hypothetical protein